jgi:hypothetical protein
VEPTTADASTEGVGLGTNGNHLPLRELREADGIPKSNEPAMTLRCIFFLLALTLLLRGEAAAHHAFSPVFLLSLSRVGWTPRTVAAGQPITVTGNPTHTGSPRIFFTRIVLADGTERVAPGMGDVGAIEAQRRQRVRERLQQK